ncbi:hypothetical protein INT43_008517 [Umbelopsis isabellina]|uniref:RING-type E3 ubiquitin transferase n=1 Tax=Mortierella isabellina TaxID=91625 RepID=A0A8H7UGM0_MORIS|nr:hypothetical protein INT43_008517 [Umbelopsis isabellina]
MSEPQDEGSTSAGTNDIPVEDTKITAEAWPTQDQSATLHSVEPITVENSELRRRHNPAQSNQEESKKQVEHGEHNHPLKSSRRSSLDHTAGGGLYECNICFDTATHPVITLCGHLFCWSCLAQWLHQTSRNPTCPVCKAGCGKDKVIPIYGRGRDHYDPREDPTIPTRPAGQRPAPLRDPNMPHFFGGAMRGATYSSGNFAISAGFGAFPGLFGVTFNMGPGRSPTAQAQHDAFMSRLFLMIGTLLLITIVFCC